MPPVDTASSTVGITKPNDPFMAELYDRFNKTPFTNSPIGRVPPEVLRIIIVLAVSHPGDSRTVLRASHVSRKWRDVVLATSELFTHADWDHWHVELLRGWYERSKQRPLTITLGHRTSNIIFDIVSLSQPDPGEAPHSFSLLLDVALMRCSSLSLTFFSLMHKSRDQQHEELGKFAARYPMIFDLRFTIMRGPVFPIRLDNWPTVRKLHIGLAPTLTTVSQVEHITIDFYAILRSTPFPLLPQLSYLFIYGIPAGGFGWFQNVVHLDALRHLEIRELEDDDAIEEEPFGHLMFHYLKAPNVECFTLNGMVLSSKAAAIFWPALAAAMPHTKTITCKRDRAGYWPLDIRFAGLLDRDKGPVIRQLKELQLIGRDVAHLLRPMRDLVSTLSRNPSSSITHLTLPPRSEFVGPDLVVWDMLRNLVPSFTEEDVPHTPSLYWSGPTSLPPPPIPIRGHDHDTG